MIAAVSARASSSASEVAMLLLRFEVPAPGRCSDARCAVLIDRVRATLFVVADVEGEDDSRGELELELESVGLRPGVAPIEGFLMAADIFVNGSASP